MKTAFLTLSILLFGVSTYAQSIKSFQALNPEVKQGDVLIIKIAAQWMPPATSNPTIFIFGKHYQPNKQGRVLVGIPMDIPPDEYTAIFFTNGRRDGFDEEKIKVSKTSFQKTRISSFIGEPNPRTGNQYERIRDAFGPKNQSEPDLTGGFWYIDPLGIARDVIDPFGLIYENNPYRRHEGVDLKAPVGTEVRAVNIGRVVLVAKNFRTEGNMIIINHGLGVFSVYMHLSKFKVKEGDMVRQKQEIGLSGRSGRGVREPHLHFNIKIGDTYVDPLEFINTINQYILP